MIPDVVHFTGLEIDPQAILHPRRLRSSVIPASWQRVRFKIPDATSSPFKIDRWIGVNIPGRWASYTLHLMSEDESRYDVYAIVAFESVSDAVLFRLKEGERAWLEDNE